jgi:hypothetical protein
MELVIRPTGQISCIYDETIDLHELGKLSIRRASHVEPTVDGQWLADLAPTCGPRLGPFATRSDALSAEQVWLRTFWLNQPD